MMKEVKIMKRAKLWVASLFCLGLVCRVCLFSGHQANPQGKPIVIGAPSCHQLSIWLGCREAIKLAIEEINAKEEVDVGGVKGH